MGDEALPGVGGGVAGGVDDTGVGHEEDRHVAVGDVLAQVTGLLGPGDEFEEAVVRLGAAFFERFCGGEGHGQDVGEAGRRPPWRTRSARSR
ncbi:hypothetical protein [Streptomyces chryseus]